MLTVSVLGPVEVHRDGRRLPLPAGRTSEVLVRLAVDAGRAVRVELLIADLWPDAEDTGRNTLQSKVSQLRRALGDATLVTAGPGGYTLNVEAAQVDALTVQRLADEVATARRSGDDATAAERATRALAMFRGEVLADAGDGAWVQAHRARLEEVRLGLLEDRLAALVSLGAGGELVGELEALVEVHPWREGLWSTLITALYRTGRQADALAAYARVRERLDEDLGVEPGPALRGLEEDILRQSPALGAGRAAVAGTPGNLPTLTGDIVGREADLATLHSLLREHRLVTVTGPAGVGKTRTAIEVGRTQEPPGGTWLVRLDALDAAGEVGRAVAETLHVAGGEAMLVERFAGAEAVVVLDNCEHVVDGVAGLVTRLLDGAPALRVLATSQVPLGLDGEVVHPLPPLSLDAATELFVGRASRARPQSVPAEQAATVTDLCRGLDGLPLAIELAAARARSLSVPEIARRLDDRFTLLRDPSRRAPERQRGLEAAIGWSYDLLFPDDQQGLSALAVFSGGASRAAAEHVLEAIGVPAEAALDVMDRLVERSMVAVDTGTDGAVRYRLLDSVRAYARARLAEDGAEQAACAAHAGWYAGVADGCRADVRGPRQAELVGLVRSERANVDAALAWCAAHDAALGLRIAVGLGWAWVVLGDGTTGAARVRAALAADPDHDPALAVEALLVAGWLEASAGDVAQAEADLAALAGLVDRLDPGAAEAAEADRHRHLAFLRIQQGRPPDVLEEAAAAVAADRRLGRDWHVAAALLLASYGSIMLGDTVAATAAAQEAEGLLVPIDDSWGLVHAQGMLGAVAQAEHRYDAAAVALAGAAAESERCGFLGQAALHLTRLGRVEQQRGDRTAATETLERAISAAARGGDLRISATARTTLARLLWTAGEPVPALALLEQNDAFYRRAGGEGSLLTRALVAAVTAAGDPGSPGRLPTLLDEARAASDGEAELVVLDALAAAAARAGDLATTRRWLDEADHCRSGVAHLVDDRDRVDAAYAREVLSTQPA